MTHTHTQREIHFKGLYEDITHVATQKKGGGESVPSAGAAGHRFRPFLGFVGDGSHNNFDPGETNKQLSTSCVL